MGHSEEGLGSQWWYCTFTFSFKLCRYCISIGPSTEKPHHDWYQAWADNCGFGPLRLVANCAGTVYGLGRALKSLIMIGIFIGHLLTQKGRKGVGKWIEKVQSNYRQLHYWTCRNSPILSFYYINKLMEATSVLNDRTGNVNVHAYTSDGHGHLHVHFPQIINDMSRCFMPVYAREKM